MADYIEIAQAIEMSGLRLVLIPGLPGPWGEAAKGIFYVKKVPFVRVRHKTGDPDYLEALKKWTGQTSYPVAAYNDERPRSKHDFLSQPQFRTTAVELACNGAVYREVGWVIGIEKVERDSADFRLPGGNP